MKSVESGSDRVWILVSSFFGFRRGSGRVNRVWTWIMPRLTPIRDLGFPCSYKPITRFGRSSTALTNLKSRTRTTQSRKLLHVLQVTTARKHATGIKPLARALYEISSL